MANAAGKRAEATPSREAPRTCSCRSSSGGRAASSRMSLTPTTQVASPNAISSPTPCARRRAAAGAAPARPATRPPARRRAKGTNPMKKRRRPRSEEGEDGAQSPGATSGAGMEAARRSKQRADLRSSPQDHSRRQSDLEQIAGEERHEPDAERRPDVPVRRARCAMPPRWMTAMPSAQTAANASDAGRPASRARHCRGRGKCEQISAGRAQTRGRTRPSRRRTPAGPACRARGRATSAAAPAAGPSSPPTTSTASGCSVIGTGFSGIGTATCADDATTSTRRSRRASTLGARDRRAAAGGRSELDWIHQSISTLRATALPPPRQSVARPRRATAITQRVKQRGQHPRAARADGWPSATAPPLTLTLFQSHPSSRPSAIACTANASLASMRS